MKNRDADLHVQEEGPRNRGPHTIDAREMVELLVVMRRVATAKLKLSTPQLTPSLILLVAGTVLSHSLTSRHIEGELLFMNAVVTPLANNM